MTAVKQYIWDPYLVIIIAIIIMVKVPNILYLLLVIKPNAFAIYCPILIIYHNNISNIMYTCKM